MKKRQKTKVKFGLRFLMVAAFVLAIITTQAWALVDCTAPSAVADFDNDGFTDAQECQGITLYSGAVVNTNPEIPDLFVILVPAAPSNFPPNPLEYVSNSMAAGGLGVTTHLIPFNEANPDRFVSPNIPQKAIRITEDLHPDGIILGYANQGTPNGLDEAIIYTEHIKNHVTATCAEANTPANCTDSATGVSGPAAIIPIYIKHTIAHEIGHMTSLAVEYNRRFGGYHYKSGSEEVMEQAVKYTSKGGKVTFYISTKYAEPSQVGAQLQ